jgi:hypothetical protein|tara:strand:- start:252 stop:503 length:252 start_codon:yes stop_codon:yes gene_type:complete
MNIKSIDEGIRVALKLGYKNPHCGKFCATLTKSNGGSHHIVAIEDEAQTDGIYYEGEELDIEQEGEITFNGVSFEEWKEEQND